MGEKKENDESEEEQKERGGAGWDEAPAWMQRLRAKAAEGVQDLAREQMKRRKARFEEIPEEAWAEAEEVDRKAAAEEGEEES